MEYLNLSWRSLQTSTFKLANKIKKSKEKFDLIVAIARGGLTTAHIFSDFYPLPIATFTAVSYDGIKQTRDWKVLFQIDRSVKNKRVLLIDDVADTGNTFIKTLEYLKEKSVKSIKTASVFIKTQTKFHPDYYIKETSKWIIFPYEIQETIDSVIKHSKVQKLSDDEIKLVLKKTNIHNDWMKKLVKN